MKRPSDILSRWRKGSDERVVVIEELDRGVEVTEARLKPSAKTLDIVSVRTCPTLAGLARGRTLSFSDRLMVAGGPRSATTVEGEAVLRRAHPQEPVGEGELDSLLFRALWELLNRYRGWAAKKMGVTDLDLALANVDIAQVRLGTHQAFNPLGLSGASFAVRLRVTLVPRVLLPVFEKLQSRTRELVVLEAGATLARILGDKPHFTAIVGEDQTVVFASSESDSTFQGIYAWGSSGAARSLGEELAISEKTAEDLVRRALRGEASERFERLVEKHARQEFDRFEALLEPLYGRSRHPKLTTFFHFRRSLPLLMERFSEGHARFSNYGERLTLSGVRLHVPPMLRESFPAYRHTTLALLLQPAAVPQYAFLNQLLKRRARWLIPAAPATTPGVPHRTGMN